jgi:26S proteasome regulatory subunit N1
LLVSPDDRSFLETAARIWAQFDRYPEAMALAVKLSDRTMIRELFAAPRNPYVQ